MSATILCFALLIVLMPIISIKINHTQDIHYRYMIERALKAAAISAYEKNEMETSFEVFKQEFILRAPEKFVYEVELKSFEVYPKMVHYEVVAQHDHGYTYTLDASIIEEDQYGNR